jgi:fumarate hydratase class II
MCTALAPRIGYDNAAALAKKAYHEGRVVREIAEELVGKSPEEIAAALGPPASAPLLKEKGGFPTLEVVSRLLDPMGQTTPGSKSGGGGG